MPAVLDAALLHDVVLSVIGTGLGGISAFWLALRRDRRDDRSAQTKLTGDLLDQVRQAVEWAGGTRAAYAAELDVLRAARYALEDIITELRDHAVAARALAHEYERRLGLEPTSFPPLPRPGLQGSARAAPGAV